MSKFELDIRVCIRQADPPRGSIDLSESVEIDAGGFFEVASILSKFHELAITLKKGGKDDKR